MCFSASLCFFAIMTMSSAERQSLIQIKRTACICNYNYGLEATCSHSLAGYVSPAYCCALLAQRYFSCSGCHFSGHRHRRPWALLTKIGISLRLSGVFLAYRKFASMSHLPGACIMHIRSMGSSLHIVTSLEYIVPASDCRPLFLLLRVGARPLCTVSLGFATAPWV